MTWALLGLPSEGVGWTCFILGLGALAFALLMRKRLESYARWCHARPIRCVLILAALSAAASGAYLHYYLRGGPRIIDATSYFLEARTFAAGRWSLPLWEPSGSFRGRFLLPSPDGDAQSVIFPPGYPAFLAVGFWLGSPLLMGPITAALLVAATALLAFKLTSDRRVSLVAASLSLFSAALRYHTADTMSHGLTALLVSLVLLFSLSGPWFSGRAAGFCLGWLFATRPLTFLVVASVCTPSLIRNRAYPAALFALPGIGLVMAYQYAATGSVWASPQLAYYALSDGPAGCFELGFGSNRGCLFEHGDFVRARLEKGFGPLEASLTTLGRLALHTVDVTNFAPAFLVVIAGIARGLKAPQMRSLALATLGVFAAYGLFYFDGSYPGGGARFFSDVLPLEHVLAASVLVTSRLVAFAAPTSLLGFALHAGHAHLELRDREGGRPMFERRVLEQAGLTRGLVFVGTDHGFNLGHDPSVRDAQLGLFIARSTFDARERLLWLELGQPPAFRYLYDTRMPLASPGLESLSFDAKAAARAGASRTSEKLAANYELEVEWPPAKRVEGWAKPSFGHLPCVSRGRGLRLMPSENEQARIQVELPTDGPLRPGPTCVELELWAWAPKHQATLTVSAIDNQARKPLALRVPLSPAGCHKLQLGPRVDLGPRHQKSTRFEIEASGGEVLLDRLVVSATEARVCGPRTWR